MTSLTTFIIVHTCKPSMASQSERYNNLIRRDLFSQFFTYVLFLLTKVCKIISLYSILSAFFILYNRCIITPVPCIRALDIPSHKTSEQQQTHCKNIVVMVAPGLSARVMFNHLFVHILSVFNKFPFRKYITELEKTHELSTRNKGDVILPPY